ncbi:MAG: enterochelin esterase-like enzyme [Chthonomonadaceae bacterium]|nr:enterochelin esterase-like enzyme [Chthonomonadaceae bacterium]
MLTRFIRSLGMVMLLAMTALSVRAQSSAETSVRIAIGLEAARAGSGRLLLFARKIDPVAKEPITSVDVSQFGYKNEFVAAREVTGLIAGQRLRFDATDLAFPVSLNRLPSGAYWMQALLDSDHSYAYSGRGGGDVVSEVVRVTLPLNGSVPTLTLSTTLPMPGLWEYPSVGPMFKPEEAATVNARIKPFFFTSPALSAFMGRPIQMRGLVLTPEGYDRGKERYPVVYFTQGFTATMTFLADAAHAVMGYTHDGRLPPMIWVFLDESGPTGTHEFADSVNNGPWGKALTAELIPDIERHYRTDRTAAGRFVMGHSSGGWAALWLQIHYPKMFGGAWATAPDFCDFTHFWGADITQPGGLMTAVSWQPVEEVLGEYGGQMASFEWVFSPRGPDGRPMRLYDRTTLVIDPQVAAYWRQNWDLSQIIRSRWAELAPDLDGKVRVIVGDKDEAGLDDSARRLHAAFQAVGGRATFTYLPGKGHFNLYSEGAERMALRRKIAWQMWRVARPKSKLTDPGPPHP